MDKPSVIVVGDDPVLDQYAAAFAAHGLPSRVARSSPELREALEPLAASAAPDTSAPFIAILDGDRPHDRATLLRSVPNMPILTLSASAEYPVVEDGFRPGVDDYILKPVGPEELVLRTRAMLVRLGVDIPGLPTGAADPDIPAAGVHDGQIIVVFSPKGGIGKSTLAAHLATGLARFSSARALLVDADVWFGDVGVLLNAQTGRSIADVATGEAPNLAALERALVDHPSGLQLLLRPPALAMAETLQPEAVVQAISAYAALFDAIIVDTAPTLGELNLCLLEAANRILLVLTPEIAAVHHTARFLEVAGLLKVSDKLSLVVNRAGSGLELAALEEQFGLPITAAVPSAGKAVFEAASRGVTLFDQDPHARASITQSLVHLVEQVAGSPALGQSSEGREPARARGALARQLPSLVTAVASALHAPRGARPAWGSPR